MFWERPILVMEARSGLTGLISHPSLAKSYHFFVAFKGTDAGRLGRLHEQGIFGNESVPQFHPNQKWDGY